MGLIYEHEQTLITRDETRPSIENELNEENDPVE